MSALAPPVERFTYDLPAALEASEPPEARGLTRDAVRMLVTNKSDGSLVPSTFSMLPRFLDPGDLVVINTSGTIPAAVDATADDGTELAVHLSTQLDEARWVVEPRRLRGRTTERWDGPLPPRPWTLAGGGTLTLDEPYGRRWAPVGGPAPPGHPHAELAGGPRPSHPLPLRRTAVADRDVPERLRHRARQCRDAERGSALHARGITRLVAKGVGVTPLVLHTGVASLGGR